MRPLPYRSWLLSLLLSILAFNYVDRAVFAVALQDIKGDLSLSDTQLGLMTGIAFSLFYAIMGIPIAAWADRGNRVTIISLTTALWSTAVAACGFAGSFLQLLLIRVGVAVGEAGCVPPAHSLIADTFSRDERPRAVAIYMLGGPISVLAGYLLAGWSNQFLGWRMTFIVLAAPGLLLALLAYFTIREPRRQLPHLAVRQEKFNIRNAWVTIGTLSRIPSFFHLLAAFSVLYFFGQGTWQWQPAYFVRTFGLETGELGTWLALSVGLTGLLGTYAGGALASRFAPRNERRQLFAMAAAYTIFGGASVGIYLTDQAWIALMLTAVVSFVGATANGPLFSTLQSVIPSGSRAMSVALVYLFANLIGLGIGPLVVGALSDLLGSWAGAQSLRVSLLIMCPGYIWAAWHLVRSGRFVEADIQRAQASSQPQSDATVF